MSNVQNPPGTLLTDRGTKLQSRFLSSIQQVKCSGGWTSPPGPLRGSVHKAVTWLTMAAKGQRGK